MCNTQISLLLNQHKGDDAPQGVSVDLVIHVQNECAVLYAHLWSGWLAGWSGSFPHYLISSTIFGEKKVTEHKMF